jgi:glutamate dehydrogenase
MWGSDQLVHSSIPDDKLARPFLEFYFPGRMRNHFSAYFPEHPLRREIIATAVINYDVNNAGIALLPRLVAVSKISISHVVAAYLAADLELNGRTARQKILESGLPARTEHESLVQLEGSLEARVLESVKATQ